MSFEKNRQKKIERNRAQRIRLKKARRAAQLDAYRAYKNEVLDDFRKIFESYDDDERTPAELKKALRSAWAMTRRHEGISVVGTKK